jgi:hypothetical protein
LNYVITNGITFLKRTKDNVLVETPKLSEACVYDEDRVKKQLNCFPHIFRGKGYRAVTKKEIAENDGTVPPCEIEDNEFEHVEGVRTKVPDSERLAGIKAELLAVDDTLGRLNDTYNDICKELKEVCLEITDIEHAIELQNSNAVRRCYLENELKKARMKRRDCKDIKELLEGIAYFTLKDWGTGKVQKAIDWSENRVYCPRIRNDLFE